MRKQTTDERQGRPSASGIPRLALCPGSWNLSKKVKVGAGNDEYAAMGERIHKAVENAFKGKPLPVGELSDGEYERTVQIQSQMVQILDAQAPGWDAPDSGWIVLSEKRLWGAENRFSGRFDLAAVNEQQGKAIVLDAKSGWADTPAASVNLQLRSLALLVSENYGVSTVVVGIVQPTKGKPSLAIYDKLALADSAIEINRIITAAEERNAPRNPSAAACKFCPAIGICREAHNAVAQVVGKKLPGEWAARLELFDVAQMVIDAGREEAKALLSNDPNAIPGWGLSKGRTITRFPDAQKVLDALGDIIPHEEFLHYCQPGLEALRKAFKAHSGLKGKAALEAFNDRVKDCIEIKQSAPSLKRIDPNKENNE